MSGEEIVCRSISDGNASRYIKPRWINGDVLSTEAFDLREGSPPETYVSHFMASGESLDEIFKSAYEIINGKIEKCHKGSIAILDVRKALSEVNDEAEPLIGFLEKGLPHCGLIYKTQKQEKIQEAKATLCVLAGAKMISAAKIQLE